MAVKKALRRLPPAGRGAGSKIVRVNEQQGFGNLANQQGTTRIIFDAIPLATNANTNVVTLFQDCRTRKFPLTNLTENKLQYKESTVMQRFSFFIIETASGTTNALDVFPLDYFSEYKRLKASTFSFYIANDRVIKDFPLASMYAPFNKDARFMGQFQTHPNGGNLTTFNIPQDVYEFDNEIVIPPEVEFRCDVTIPAITNPAGFDFYLAMKIEGLGSLFAPKSRY